MTLENNTIEQNALMASDSNVQILDVNMNNVNIGGYVVAITNGNLINRDLTVHKLISRSFFCEANNVPVRSTTILVSNSNIGGNVFNITGM